VIEQPEPGPHQYLVAACGFASFALLLASFLGAHYWGPRADTIVAGWTITTLIAGIGGVRMEGRAQPSWLATSAMAFTAISLLALVIGGLSYVFGTDPTGSCGGG
jgi:hypothetical protein